MKRYVFLAIALLMFTFSLGGKEAQAYDYGCYAGSLYSITTGYPCSGAVNSQNYTYIPGCTGTNNIYSTVTGQPCSPYTPNYNNTNYNNTYSVGSRGDTVRLIQQVLKDRGFLYGNVDGIFGPITRAALINYQQYNGLSATGIAESTTLAKMGIITNNIPIDPCPVYYVNGIAQYSCNTSSQLINSVSGPQNLNINQQGTWTVNASNSNGGYLNYSVDWGDIVYGIYGNAYANSTPVQQGQTATFTHSYTNAGTYTVRFTVTNSIGQTATSSITVIVSGNNSGYYNTPTISYISPSSGYVGSQVTIYGTGFSYSNCSGYICPTVITSNTINFGSVKIENVISNGTSLTFTVPYVPNNTYCIQYPCNQTYGVSVTNMNGLRSNIVNFTVNDGILYY